MTWVWVLAFAFGASAVIGYLSESWLKAIGGAVILVTIAFIVTDGLRLLSG